MKVYSLEAKQKIVKKYTKQNDGKIVKENYPLISEFSSELTNLTKLDEFLQLLRKVSQEGKCLIKGVLNRDLNNEKRAGATDPDTKTEWVCLDFDGINYSYGLNSLLERLNLGNIDRIVQWSSSMNVESESGIRCHVFMLLDQETHPSVLKQWLQTLNFENEILSSQLQLAKSGNALRYPLDITTCQNDKLIYVSPPIFHPESLDPFPGDSRIEIHTGQQLRKLSIPSKILSTESLRSKHDEHINRLRKEQGLEKKKKAKFLYKGDIEYLANPSAARVTGIKHERNFVYLNLNGGDSWGYYHPDDNPEFIYNFKGEPTYRTSDLAPGYYSQLVREAREGKPDSRGCSYLAFRDFQSATYYNGTYDATTDQVSLAVAKSETQLRQFLTQHGQVMGEYVPDWNLKFDPKDKGPRANFQDKVLNTYNPSSFLKSKITPTTTIPPVCKKIIEHVLGYDNPTVEHFLNWVACIVQYQERTGTAWILHGTEGTGKGLLFHYILSPLLGPQNTVAKRMEEIESEFTGYMEGKFVVFVDEIESGRNLFHAKITAKLKNLIVEPRISIRKMHQLPYMVENFGNMIFASNKGLPVEVSPEDRRFNVAPFQSKRLNITSTEVESLSSEIQDLCDYLRSRSADRDKARTPLVSFARSQLIDTGRQSLDVALDALRAGDVSFFWDQLPSKKMDLPVPGLGAQLLENKYRNLVVDIVQNQPTSLSRDEVYVLMEWCVGGMPQTPNKFTTVLKHHSLHLEPIWKDGRTVRGVKTTWVCESTTLAIMMSEISSGLV